jgi:carboxymethylenebutenolidase
MGHSAMAVLTKSETMPSSRIVPRALLVYAFACLFGLAHAETPSVAPEIVHFKNADLNLAGEIFRPPGKGPFPAVLYNHGSAPGMLNSEASLAMGPLFAHAGWIFFMPYRRGQGLSASAGPYIGDVVSKARREGGEAAAAATVTRLLETDQLNDEIAAYAWLASQPFVAKDRIALDGNSYGGIETILGAEKLKTCAAVAASAASETWHAAPELQRKIIETASRLPTPLLLFQAENDYDLAPNKAIFAARRSVGRAVEYKLYPRYGWSERAGHSFAYRGAQVWFPDVLAFLNKTCAE